MRQYILFFSVFSLFSLSCIGQSSQFSKGQADYNLGVGLITTLGTSLEDNEIKASTKIPLISLTGDFAVSNEISIGGYLGFAKHEFSFSSNFYSNPDIGSVTDFIVGIRGLYHFDLSPKFDLYAGGMLGYNAAKVDVIPVPYRGVPITVKGYAYTLLAGGRYHFSENIGAFMELGYGTTVVTAGFTMKGGHKPKPEVVK